MFCPKGESNAKEVPLVEMFIKYNSATKNYFNKELKLQFKEFILKYTQEYFMDMSDISCYK